MFTNFTKGISMFLVVNKKLIIVKNTFIFDMASDNRKDIWLPAERINSVFIHS